MTRQETEIRLFLGSGTILMKKANASIMSWILPYSQVSDHHSRSESYEGESPYTGLQVSLSS